MSKHLLAPGNEKLGRGIDSFSLPKGETCPGKSELCDQKCYTNRFARFNLQDLYADHLAETKRPDFVARVRDEILESGIQVVRIHVSGDFYSAAYVRKWIRIVQQTPDCVYYAYTRSWRVPRLRRALDELRRQPNVQLWWSTDKECEPPPEGRVAYMSTADDDVPGEEVGASLIFRTNRKTPRRRLNKILVCPKENGIKEDPKNKNKNKNSTCTTCRICFKCAVPLRDCRRRSATGDRRR